MSRAMKRSFLTVLIFIFCPVLLISARPGDTSKYQKARTKMVDYQIRMRGISNQKVLRAMALIPRHLFVPAELINQAYEDHPLPIGQGQTISQPYIVALMTESLQFKGDERVLEIGTGSGYQAAILAKVAKEVYTIEIKEKLFKKADKLLQSMDFNNVQIHNGDGYFGWADAAPFDCIMITAAVDHIPPPLLKQLKDRGRLILPLGNPFSYQNLSLVTKNKEDYSLRQITGVLFVPMTGHALSPNSSSRTFRKDFP
jgi:protein-L-isoaspartate(D-aspartate) O-methyltransferase